MNEKYFYQTNQPVQINNSCYLCVMYTYYIVTHIQKYYSHTICFFMEIIGIVVTQTRNIRKCNNFRSSFSQTLRMVFERMLQVFWELNPSAALIVYIYAYTEYQHTYTLKTNKGVWRIIVYVTRHRTARDIIIVYIALNLLRPIVILYGIVQYEIYGCQRCVRFFFFLSFTVVSIMIYILLP